MNTRHATRSLGVAAFLALAAPLLALNPKYQDAVKARMENGYAILLLSGGTKMVVPLDSLRDDDRAFITKLSLESPLGHGRSEVKVVSTQVAAKKTVSVSTTVGPVETVQLVAPNLFRDQIGATCMVYARVHWLDIAGYYVTNVDLYKVINNADANQPWLTPTYYQSMYQMVMGFNPRPVVHNWTAKSEPFEWTRSELRKGRPVLAAFPKEIWQDLPPGYVGEHPWYGGNVGHQVVINGFTFNKTTNEGTFHIVNSWRGLPEFDLKTEAARGAMVVQQSLSPIGEPPEAVAAVHVTKVTLLRPVGKLNLYEVDTDKGAERVAAADEDRARAMVAVSGSP